MTNTSFKLIFAALAATVVLAGCTKEITPGKADTDPKAPVTEGTRVITVSFAPQTKTNFTSTADGGIQPQFAKDDEILLVSYPENSDPITETRKVSVDDNTGVATISTNLTGDLMALYPAKYAKQMPNGKFGLPVPAVQTGKFADANLCGTQIKDGEQSATFQNGTPLFIITPPEGATRLTIKSLKQIGSNGQRTGSRYAISQNEESDTQYTISIPNGSCEDGNYYVAVAETNGHLKLSDLSFEVEYETSGTGAVKGITTSAIAAVAGGAVNTEAYEKCNTVAPRTAYTIDKNNWHDYVTIEGRKWATMNVGANAPEEIGDYFVWGTTVKAYSEVNTTSNRFTFVEENPYGDIYKNIWDKNDGYNWKNTPFTQGVYNDTTTTQVFYKYTAEKTDIAYNAEYDGKTILDLEDDAAYVNWGGAWRIPQKEEFNSIVNLAGEWDETSKGIKLQGLFFLAGGAGGYADPYSEPGFPNGLDLIDFEGGGSYLSSSVNVEDPKCIHTFGFDYYGGDIDISINAYSYRYHGKLVRAIVDDPDYMELAD